LKNIFPIADYFYKVYFKKQSFINKLNSMIYGIRDGKQISFSEFKTMKLPYPDLKEQKKIADFLSSLDELIDSKQKQISHAEKWKKGLMQRMFI
jgi:type I restriction enzyme S subunit